MTQPAPSREALLELSDALAQHQLRDAGAEVAAAIAHAVGTPLNVISGRAELIRHDPANALVQVTRIEEQVKKLALGLRQLVDYLALPEPGASPRPAQPSSRGGDGEPATLPSGSSRPPPGPALGGSGASAIVEARSILDDVLALAQLVAPAAAAELSVDGSALEGARVERWHALGTLNALVASAVREAGGGGGSASSPAPKVRVSGRVATQGVLFEVVVPGLAPIEGWQLEHFQVRPALDQNADFYRTMSICGAVVRGHGGKLQMEASAAGDGSVIRFSCRNESA